VLTSDSENEEEVVESVIPAPIIAEEEDETDIIEPVVEDTTNNK
jgi:hypothetical protein